MNWWWCFGTLDGFLYFFCRIIFSLSIGEVYPCHVPVSFMLNCDYVSNIYALLCCIASRSQDNYQLEDTNKRERYLALSLSSSLQKWPNGLFL